MAAIARGRSVDSKPLANGGVLNDVDIAVTPDTTSLLNVDIEPYQPATKEDSPHSSSQHPLPSESSPPTKEEAIPESTPNAVRPRTQKYPWLSMASTLEACFQTTGETEEASTTTKKNRLIPQENTPTGEESGVYHDHDQRDTNFQQSRLVASDSGPGPQSESCDDGDGLSIDSFAENAPKIMQAFLSHGDVCTRVEAEALELATHGDPELNEDAPLQVYRDVLERLDELLQEALELESSIANLTALYSGVSAAAITATTTPTTTTSSSSSSLSSAEEDSEIKQEKDQDQEQAQNEEASAREKVLGIFAACLPVLRARISNLTMAQELTDGAQENLSITLRMESLGLLD